ncbi:hypothetical protein E4M02_11200 [Brevundimonas sp. S30B]|uniref:hypothetical protein n=1 Tax=unclassified Brevundimonas TaxID=2622653 RepID=UPI0010729B31|nr:MULTISPECIES: hypothetical protein [unclassified Brevundimonas]QBX38681.1 hypothetical protein E4M01_13460 [Brevundimonas sp. MF30-B]TFW01272.1 hypothetical protein E4M02_11200 [Brevundimonas sp. S30B]
MPTVSYGIATTADDALTIPGVANSDTGLLFGEIGGASSTGAVRFLGVAISPSDTILSAEITFTREAVSQLGLSPISNGTNAGKLHGVKVANQGSLPADLTTLSKTTASTTIVPGVTVVVDVLAAVQEIQALSGWASGNAMAFVGDPSTAPAANYIEFYDRNRSSTLCAQLSITYEAGGPDETPPTITSTADATVYEGDGFAQTLTANETVTWAIVGGADAALFSLSGAVLSLPEQLYLSPADANADNVYVVQVQAEDAAGNLSTIQTKNITIEQAPLVRWIGGASGTNTATLPPHKAGDAIFAAAFRDGSATLPTLPSGQNWSSILAPTGANTCSARAAGKIAASSGEAVGTFTNATTVDVGIWRPRPGYTLSFGAAASASGSSTTVSYPALTLQDTSGSSWVMGWAGHRSVNTTLETPPTGMTNRLTTVDATDETALHDTNGGVSSWSLQTRSVGGTSSGWFGFTVELKAASAGGANASASGQTQTATASLIAGGASAQRNVSAAGQTLTATASLIAGSASATRAVSAAGQTLAATASLTAGAGSAVRSATAEGQVVTATATLSAGAASASQTVEATGVTITASASLIAGAGSTGQSASAPGVILTTSATLMAGQASTGSLALGQELQASASLTPGAGSASGQTTGAGQVLSVFASFIPGVASVTRSAAGTGQTLAATAALIPGAAGGSASAAGQLLIASASILPGPGSATRNASSPGVQITASASLIPGEAEAVRNVLGSGALLSALASLTPGSAQAFIGTETPPERRLSATYQSRAVLAHQQDRSLSSALQDREMAATDQNRALTAQLQTRRFTA